MSIRIRWNYSALRQIRMSGAGLVEEQVSQICDTANGMSRSGGFGYEVHESGGAGRARGTVFPETARAMAANRRDNIVVRALGSQ